MLSDPGNWTAGVFYSNAEDTRAIVRSRKIGWTMNCAKPLGWILVILFFASIIGANYFSMSMGHSTLVRLGVIIAATIPWLFLFSALSKPASTK
jgi:protein-S-isoprenylcysteine O-methyltransferase Ste14